jgi:hypothetical protein
MRDNPPCFSNKKGCWSPLQPLKLKRAAVDCLQPWFFYREIRSSAPLQDRRPAGSGCRSSAGRLACIVDPGFGSLNHLGFPFILEDLLPCLSAYVTKIFLKEFQISPLSR